MLATDHLFERIAWSPARRPEAEWFGLGRDGRQGVGKRIGNKVARVFGVERSL